MRKIRKNSRILSALFVMALLLQNVTTVYAATDMPVPVTGIQDLVDPEVRENVEVSKDEADKAQEASKEVTEEVKNYEESLDKLQEIVSEAKTDVENVETTTNVGNELVEKIEKSLDDVYNDLEIAVPSLEEKPDAVDAEKAAKDAEKALEDAENAKNFAEVSKAANAAQEAADTAKQAEVEAKKKLDMIQTAYDTAKEGYLTILKSYGTELTDEQLSSKSLLEIYDLVVEKAKSDVDAEKAELDKIQGDLSTTINSAEGLEDKFNAAQAAAKEAEAAAKEAAEKAAIAANKVANMHVDPANEAVNEIKDTLNKAKEDLDLIAAEKAKAEKEADDEIAKQKAIKAEKEAELKEAQAKLDAYNAAVKEIEELSKRQIGGAEFYGEKFYTSVPIDWARKVEKTGVGNKLNVFDTVSEKEYQNALAIIAAYNAAEALKNSTNKSELDATKSTLESEISLTKEEIARNEADKKAADESFKKQQATVESYENQLKSAKDEVVKEEVARDTVLEQLKGKSGEEMIAILEEITATVDSKNDIYLEILNDLNDYIWASDIRNEGKFWKGEFWKSAALRIKIEEKYWAWLDADGTWIIFNGTEANEEYLKSVKTQAADILKSVEEQQAMVDSAIAKSNATKAAEEAAKAIENAKKAQEEFEAAQSELEAAKKALENEIKDLNLDELRAKVQTLEDELANAKTNYEAAKEYAVEAQNTANKAKEIASNFATFYVRTEYNADKKTGKKFAYVGTGSVVETADGYQIVYPEGYEPGNDIIDWSKAWIEKFADGWHVNGDYIAAAVADVYVLKRGYELPTDIMAPINSNMFTESLGTVTLTDRIQVGNVNGLDTGLFGDLNIDTSSLELAENETIVWHAIKFDGAKWHLDGHIVEVEEVVEEEISNTQTPVYEYRPYTPSDDIVIEEEVTPEGEADEELEIEDQETAQGGALDDVPNTSENNSFNFFYIYGLLALLFVTTKMVKKA